MAEGLSRSETVYDGVRYRSKQHARWAVFFDILGLEHFYEPQAFKVGSAVHSPTFLLPGVGNDLHAGDALTVPGVFVDLQVAHPTVDMLEIAKTISQHTDKNVCIFYGTGMTSGLEWWPSVLEKPRPCFFSQCPFCGRFGISSTSLEDGQREGWSGVHCHACMEEYKIPERYNVLGHCSQDLLVTPHSPALNIAYEAVRTFKFGDNARELALISKQGVEAVVNTKTYCTADITEKIIANALKWAEEKSEWMCFDGAPWWVQHKKDAAAGVRECTCYSCIATRRSAREKEIVELPVQTRIQ